VTPNLALDAALALARTPTLVRGMRERPLPSGVSTLLSIVADEPGALARAARDIGCEEGHLHAAVELYLQQVMLFPGAPAHRVMGVAAQADRGEGRRHLRLLMTWLHPDKNAAAWRSAFATRVLTAWREFSSAPPVSRAMARASDARPGRRPARPAARTALRGDLRLPWVARPLAHGRRRRAGWLWASAVAAAFVLAAGAFWLEVYAGEPPHSSAAAAGAAPPGFDGVGRSLQRVSGPDSVRR
jgi:hypothetical protein